MLWTVWMITLAVIATLSGTRAAEENGRAEITTVSEECINGFADCFCNITAIEDSLICNLFSSFITNNNSIDLELSIPPEITKLTLNIVNDAHEDKVTISSNLLWDDAVRKLVLFCQDKSFHLLVNKNQIRFSAFQANLVSFEIRGCNLEKFSFAFVADFPNLERIKIKQSTFPTSSTLESIPILESWQSLEITDCIGKVEWSSPPSVGTIIDLNLENNVMGDDAVIDILDSMLTYNNFLETINLKNNSLAEMPELVNSFPNLRSFDISENIITHLPRGSLNPLSGNITFIGLDYQSLRKIDPEAFHGSFGHSTISLRHNSLRCFEMAVFKNILDQMMDSGGEIDITGNEIECDCSLMWLIKDHRDLLPRVSGGRCSNSSSFEELDPSGWWACDERFLPSIYSAYTVVYEELNTTASTYLSSTDDAATDSESTFRTMTSIIDPSDSFYEEATATTTLDITVVDDSFNEGYTDEVSTTFSSSGDFFETITSSTPNEMTYDTFTTEITIFSSTLPLFMSSIEIEGNTTEENVNYEKVTERPEETEQLSTTTDMAREFYSDFMLNLTDAPSTSTYSTENYFITYNPDDDKDKLSTFRPYPIQIKTETPGYVAPLENDFLLTTERNEMSSVPMITNNPVTDDESKSWLERHPFIGPYVIIWLIMLPIMLHSVVYFCG